ncbi:MAG TPA: ParB N-terminal domain-containing protein [bacterium]|nr:ParB N-terminal domain-containing protein [bacterium]
MTAAARRSEREELVSVLISDLNKNLFVRQELDQNHVLYLAELIEAGVVLNPIEITPDMAVIDGRHRIEAAELNSQVEIKARIVSISDESELVARAYRANVGGALPPTQEDTEHTVLLLLDRGVAKKRIGELLGLPASLARKYVNEVQFKLKRQRLQRAVLAVTEGGLTVAKAAEQYAVEPAQLKEALSGKKKKWGISEIKLALSNQYRASSKRNSSICKKMIEKFEDGDVTAKQAMSIFNHLEHLQRRSARLVADWKKRFEAKTQI